MICLPLRPPETLFAAAALLGLLAGAAQGQTAPFGPLSAEEGSPLQRVTYTPMFEAAEPTAPGIFTADLWMGYSNIFEQDSSATHVLFMDLERLISTTTVRYGIADGWEVGGRITLETTGGGVLDGAISWWHEHLRVGNANRGRFPSDGYAQRLVDGSGEVRLDTPSRTLALEDVRLFAKRQLYVSEDGARLLSLRSVVRVPTQDNGVSDERTDVAVMLLGRTMWGPVHVHGMMGASTIRASEEMDPLLRGGSAFLTVAGEYPLADWVSAVVQYGIASPVVQGFGHRELDSPPMNLVFGLTGRRGEDWRWDVSFQEDIPWETPAIDFTLGIRVSRSW